MSGIGSDPDEYTPGNQPDGSYYNPFPNSAQPGLLGAQYAQMMANTPGLTSMDKAALGINPDIGDGTGLPPSVTIAPYLPQLPDTTAAPASFNLYDMLRQGLNTSFGSGALQIAHGLSQGMEEYGPFAAQLGTAGAVGGAVTGNLPFAGASAILAILGAGMDGLGHGLDAGTAFLDSIRQGNRRPLEDFKQRMETPGFYDLEFPAV